MISFLVVNDGQHLRVEVSGTEAVIGRDPDVDVQVQNDRTSRRHARVERTAEGCFLEDLGASNGTFCNDQRVTQAVKLNRGDRIGIGDAIVTFLGGEVPSVAGVGHEVPESGHESVAEAAPEPPQIPGYSIKDHVARGALSDCWQARQDALGRDVVIKALRPRWRGDRALVDRFNRLSRAQSRLQVSGVASGIDMGVAHDVPWFALEVLSGRTAENHLREVGTLSPEDAKAALESLLSSLVLLHEQDKCVGRLHANAVMLDDSSPTMSARLTGVGLPLTDDRQWPSDRISDLAWMAPERARGTEEPTPASDLWQLGALGLFLLSGRAPRGGHSLQDLHQARAEVPDARWLVDVSCPKPLIDWLVGLVNVDPALRPDSARTALAKLEGLDLGSAKRSVKAGTRAPAVAASPPALGETERAPMAEAEKPRGKQFSRRFILVNRAFTIALAIVANIGVFFLLKDFTWSFGGDESSPTVVERNGDSDVTDPMEAPTPIAAPATENLSEEELRSLFASTEQAVNEYLADARFAEALSLLDAFSTRYGNDVVGQDILRLTQKVQTGRMERIQGLFGQVNDHLEHQDDLLAENVLKELRVLARDVAEDRLALAEAKVKAARLARLKREGERPNPSAASGATPSSTAGDPPPPETAATPTTEKPPKGGAVGAAPKGAGKLIIEKLLKQPLHAKPVAEIREALGSKKAGHRVVASLAQAHEALAVALRAQVGKEISFQTTEGQPLKRLLVDVGDKGLQFEGAAAPVPLDQLSTPTLLGWIKELGPQRSALVLCALLNQERRAFDEAWFDLQGVLILSEGDPQQTEEAQWLLRRLAAARN